MPEQPRPQRLQLSRRKGYRKPVDAVIVARPSQWGNPYRLKPGSRHTLIDQHGNEYSCAPGAWRAAAVRHFREDLMDGRLTFDRVDVAEQMAGKDLACWCPPPAPGEPDHCHAAVLLEIANQPTRTTDPPESRNR